MLANPRKQIVEHENRNGAVLGTLADELGICLQSCLKSLRKIDLEEQLHDYCAPSPEPACTSLERSLGIDGSCSRGTPRTYRLLHVREFMAVFCILCFGKVRAPKYRSNHQVSYRIVPRRQNTVPCRTIPYRGGKNWILLTEQISRNLYTTPRCTVLPIYRIAFTDTRNTFIVPFTHF